MEIRGRCRTLRVNYRTSHQIRAQADRLLDKELTDVDGNSEGRRGTVSVFNGPKPEICLAKTEQEEIDLVAAWLLDHAKSEGAAHEIAVLVRSNAELGRAKAAAEKACLECNILDERAAPIPGRVTLGTMNLVKGLEFKAVCAMACDANVIPLKSRVDAIGEESELEDVYNTERQLLYVAITRAREHLLVTGVGRGSEFLGDMKIMLE